MRTARSTLCTLGDSRPGARLVDFGRRRTPARRLSVSVIFSRRWAAPYEGSATAPTPADLARRSRRVIRRQELEMGRPRGAQLHQRRGAAAVRAVPGDLGGLV